MHPGFVLLTIFCFEFFVCLFVFQNRISLCIPGCPETSYADQGGLELTEIPASLCFLSAGINDNQAKER